MSDYFKSPQLQAVFISILTDFFTPPNQFQGLGVFALNSEASFDARIPKQIPSGADQLYYYNLVGGTTNLEQALVNVIESHNGKIHLNESVSHIVVENNQVKGVETSKGQFYPADVVVASGGAKKIFFDLVGKEKLPEDFSKRWKTCH